MDLVAVPLLVFTLGAVFGVAIGFLWGFTLLMSTRLRLRLVRLLTDDDTPQLETCNKDSKS